MGPNDFQCGSFAAGASLVCEWCNYPQKALLTEPKIMNRWVLLDPLTLISAVRFTRYLKDIRHSESAFEAALRSRFPVVYSEILNGLSCVKLLSWGDKMFCAVQVLYASQGLLRGAFCFVQH